MGLDSSARSTILFVADGLRPSALGPYGNTWFDTHCFNLLGGQSLLFEQCIADSTNLESGLLSLLSGKHCCNLSECDSKPLKQISSTDTDTILVTTPNRMSDYRKWFDHVVEAEISQNTDLCADWTETSLASYFAAAIQTIRELEKASFVVLDCPALTCPWDAPLEMRMQLTDDEDPEPAEFVEPPNLQFNDAADDPDMLFGFQAAYSAQVVLLDRMMTLLFEELDRQPWSQEALFCLTATRAFPLGEHGVVGYYRSVLHNELLHVPTFVRFPPSHRIIGRSQQLIQPGSLNKLICDWHGVELDSSTSFTEIAPENWLADKKRAGVISKTILEESEFYSFQTQAWKYISGPSCKLYVRPDDPWEFNDASELCPGITTSMHQHMVEAVMELAQGRRPVFDLPAELAFGVE